MMQRLKFKNFKHYLNLIRFFQPIGFFLVAWPALWALLIASDGSPDLLLVFIFLLGSFLMRSAGCIINDFADRDFDGYVKRTQYRPLATKVISPSEALQLFFIFSLVSCLLLFTTNILTFFFAICAFALATLYPFTKRFFNYPQVILGLAFSCSIPMAFAAQTEKISFVVLPVYLAVICWVVCYDTFYALADKEDDKKIGIRSTALIFGKYTRSITIILQIIFITLMSITGLIQQYKNYFFYGIFIVIILFVYQQCLVNNGGEKNFLKAFKNNNLVGLIIFSSLFLELNIS